MYQTERLLVRHITTTDVEAMCVVYGDRDAMRWVDDGEPLSLAQCQEWLRVTIHNYNTRGYGMSAIELRQTGEVVGFIGIVHPGGQETAEIKYALKRAHWGRGLATEAATGMLPYIQRSFAIRRVIATIAPQNGASRRVLEKAGFAYRETLQNDDGTETEVLEWMAA